VPPSRRAPGVKDMAIVRGPNHISRHRMDGTDRGTAHLRTARTKPLADLGMALSLKGKVSPSGRNDMSPLSQEGRAACYPRRCRNAQCCASGLPIFGTLDAVG
jgi:hypothetical protein